MTQTLFAEPTIYELKQQYSEMNEYALAAWYRHYQEDGNTDECLKIEQYVNNLPLNQRYYISKLNYYKPISKPLSKVG